MFLWTKKRRAWENSVDAKLDLVVSTQNTIVAMLRQLNLKETNIMTSVADIQAKAAATLAQVTAESSVVNAVKAVVDNSNSQIATLKQQLSDAIAAGVDPAALQTLSDTIDAIQAADTANSGVVSAAVAAGTPAAPAAPTS